MFHLPMFHFGVMSELLQQFLWMLGQLVMSAYLCLCVVSYQSLYPPTFGQSDPVRLSDLGHSLDLMDWCLKGVVL